MNIIVLSILLSITASSPQNFTGRIVVDCAPLSFIAKAPIADVSNARILKILRELRLDADNLGKNVHFVPCETKGLIPYEPQSYVISKDIGSNKWHFLLYILVTAEAQTLYTDEALSGAIAREIAKYSSEANGDLTYSALWDGPDGTTNAYEVMIDKIAIDMVGKKKIIAALETAKDVAEKYYPEDRAKAIASSIKVRLEKLK